MIDKELTGKRIAQARRALGLNQSQLAQQLGVTAQAVSKWERGMALPDLELLLVLSKRFGVTINELLEGRDLLGQISQQAFVWEESGVAIYLPDGTEFSPGWAAAMVEEGWIARNWAQQRATGGVHPWLPELDIARTINAHGGVILEIGVGPGGGFVPAILQDNPDATLILSDLSPTVVREWKRLLDRQVHSPNLYYAALDHCALPFRDQSIDVISDAGGLGNTIGDRRKALKELYRVLKPGGLLVSGTGFVTQETLQALPLEVQQVLTAQRPDIFEDLYAAAVSAGFRSIDSIVTSGWDTDSDDSAIASLAQQLGVNLHFTSYLRICHKESGAAAPPALG